MEYFLVVHINATPIEILSIKHVNAVSFLPEITVLNFSSVETKFRSSEIQAILSFTKPVTDFINYKN